jgi:hypothetical protein
VPYPPTWARENLSRWVYSDTLWGRSRVNPILSKVHGTYRLPPGYCFAVLPRNTLVLPSIEPGEGDRLATKTTISSSFNPAKAMSSIVQLLSALQVLVLHRGDTVRQWGYASYVLTVIPYSVMSLVNLISNICSPDYPCLYMVRTEIMTEAELVKGEFEGVVGRTFPANGPAELGFGHGPEWTGVTIRGLLRTRFGLHRIFKFMAPPPEYISKTEITITAADVIEPQDSDAGSDVSMLSTENTQEVILHANNGCSYLATIALQRTNLRSVAWQVGNELLANHWLLRRLDPTSRATLRDMFEYEHEGRSDWQAFKSNLKKILWPIFVSCIGMDMKEGPKLSHRTRIYYPSCGRFLRQDDKITFPDGVLDARQSGIHRIHGLSAELAASLPALTGPNSVPPATSRRREKGIGLFSFATYVVSALLFAGFIIGATAILSEGFHPGFSSSTQRGIMMAWLATGIAIGVLLPLLSLLDWVKILVFLPLAYEYPYPVISYSKLLPIAVFIPPIWGFVLVGLMLKKWGDCVTLY